jgi:hypothetical protein
MYDLTLNIETEQSGLTFLPPGIHENLRLARPDGAYPISFEKSKNGNNFIAFNIMNPEGPQDEDPTKLTKKEANLAKRLRHIGKKFVSEDALKAIGKVESFEQLAKAYIRIIGDNYKNVLLRGKIIYNNKNYTTFPNYVPFVESMSIPLEDSKLKMSPDDKVVKTKADVIIPKANPFTANPSPDVDGQGDINNLPF